MILPPQRFTLFPYTTLFRSSIGEVIEKAQNFATDVLLKPVAYRVELQDYGALDIPEPPNPRSEEHTSELQSLTNLVCRLLLEKKKKKWTHPMQIVTSPNRIS